MSVIRVHRKYQSLWQYVGYFIVFAFIFYHPSLLDRIILQKIGVHNHRYLEPFLLLLGSIFIYISNSKIAYTKIQKIMQSYFIWILTWLVLVWILRYEFVLTGTSTRVFLFAYIFGLILFSILNNNKFDFNQLIYAYIFVAAFLAGLSLVQYFGTNLGLVDVTRIRGDVAKDLQQYRGIGGYEAGTIYGSSTSWLKRNYGFFTEPTYFAQFLQIPLFLSFSFYQIKKKKKLLIAFIILLFAIILTFSVANFIGFFFSISIYLLLKSSRKTRVGFFNRLLILMGATGLLIIMAILYNTTNESKTTYEEKGIVAKDFDRNVADRIDRVYQILAHSESFVFGDMFFRSRFSRNLSFFGTCLKDGGFVLVITFFFFFFYLYRNVLKYMMKSQFPFLYVGYISILFPTMWVAEFNETHLVFIWVFIVTFMKWESIITQTKTKVNIILANEKTKT